MNGAAMRALIDLSGRREGPIAEAARAATAGAAVDPGKLRAALAKAGLKLHWSPRAGRAELTVTDRAGRRLAYANAGDEGDAILHAALGALRERA